jgi:alpha-beta hydrolase superfamily lysophospholipase
MLYLSFLILVIRFSLSPKRMPYFISPGMMGLPQEDVELRTKDGVKLRGWWSNHDAPRGLALVVHGYIMNRSEMTPVGAWLHARGYAMLAIDLRAHGRSGGKRTTLGYFERFDVLAACEWLKARHPELPLIVIGSSMGAAAAALAHGLEEAPADALVLDSVYSRLDQAILGWWRFLGGRTLELALYPVVWIGGWVMPFRLRHVDVAEALSRQPETPVLIVHGDKDDLALPQAAERNLASAKLGRIVWFRGCGHSEGRLLQPERYFQELRTFLNDHNFPS